MMPAVQDFERRLGILHEVEPIIEKAVQTLTKAIDLSGSPLEPPKPKPVPVAPKQEDEFSLDSLTSAAAAPAAGGIDLSQLAGLFGGQAPAAEPEAEPAAEAGGLDLSALLGGLGGAAAPAPAEEEESSGDSEKAMLMKLLGKM